MDALQRIPEAFVKALGDELSDVAILTVPNGHFWQVALEKANKEIWFHKGWQDFVEYHSIGYGCFLVFRYEGSSKFHVRVLDHTATEIEYPQSKNRRVEDQVDVMESGDDDDELIKENEMCGSETEKPSRGRKRAIEAARMLKPKSPWFMAILRPHHLRVHRSNLVSLSTR